MQCKLGMTHHSATLRCIRKCASMSMEMYENFDALQDTPCLCSSTGTEYQEVRFINMIVRFRCAAAATALFVSLPSVTKRAAWRSLGRARKTGSVRSELPQLPCRAAASRLLALRDRVIAVPRTNVRFPVFAAGALLHCRQTAFRPKKTIIFG